MQRQKHCAETLQKQCAETLHRNIVQKYWAEALYRNTAENLCGYIVQIHCTEALCKTTVQTHCAEALCRSIVQKHCADTMCRNGRSGGEQHSPDFQRLERREPGKDWGEGLYLLDVDCIAAAEGWARGVLARDLKSYYGARERVRK